MTSSEQSRSAHPAHERRFAIGFIQPCQPVLAHEVPTEPEWMHEPTWNGYRIVARRYRSVGKHQHATRQTEALRLMERVVKPD